MNEKRRLIVFCIACCILWLQAGSAGFCDEDTDTNANTDANAKGSFIEDDANTGVTMNKDANGEDKITLDLKGIEITELFRILSVKTGLTIVPSREVTGRINIFLNNVSFEDALDIILFTQKLALERKDDILYILTEDEYRRIYGKEFVENREYKSIKLKYANPANVLTVLSEVKSDIGKVIVDEASGSIVMIDIPEKLKVMENVVAQLDTALDSYVFDLNYADSETVQQKLADVITPNTGKLIVDERSSKVIVSDLPSKMEEIKKVLKNLDEEEGQVNIEAEILQVSLDKAHKRGIDWDAVFPGSFDDLHFYSDFSNLSSDDSSFGKATIGTIERDKYTAVLEMLKTYGDVKTLSRPRITALNNQEARIHVGTRQAFVSGTQSVSEGTTTATESVEFVDVGVKLDVVPTINKDGFVSMKIKPEVSSAPTSIETNAGSIIPIVDTAEAETVVRVKDGVMIMIAGLMKREKTDEVKSVPALGDIPVIGNFFSSRTKNDDETELVVFITPHIITGDVPVEKIARDQLYLPKEIISDDIKRKIVGEEIENISMSPESLPEGKPSGISQENIDVKSKSKGIKPF